MLADILILRPQSTHDQILTYLLPAELAKVEAGSLVSVPVRRETMKGLVLRIHNEEPDIKTSLKKVRALLEITPLLTEHGLRLASWISEYYLCSLNKAVHLFLPPPIRQVAREVLVINENEEAASPRLFLGDMEQLILSHLQGSKTKALMERDIVRRLGPKAKGPLEALLTHSIVRLETEFARRAEPKRSLSFGLTNGAPKWREITKKAPRQGELLKALQEWQDGQNAQARNMPLDILTERFGRVRPILRDMVKKGWLECVEESVERSRLAGMSGARSAFRLNEDQSAAGRAILTALAGGEKKIWLLHGVTGSGKTAVYFEAIAEALLQGRQVLYLVPEIALTPQITALLSENFGELVAILHSALSAGERHDEWQRIRRGEARVVLGPRSAVFAPFGSLGLIIIDEEHENTYKQSEPEPRYDARQVALQLADDFGACVVLGSATPSLKSYDLAKKGFYELLRMPARVADRPLPEMTVVDMKREYKEGNKSIFSRELRAALEKTISSGEQAILFMNRRGYHTFILCRECGKGLTCPHCDITLTYHQAKNRLVCHYCNFQRQLPQKCPFCGSHYIRYYGTGTERVAQELEAILPGVPSLRMDADTTQNKGSHTSILKDFQERKAQILIGTQMVAKGLDFPAVTLVGIINADNIINLPDYQATERAYQLITQVSGRAGRGEQPGRVVIQTFGPDNYLFEAITAQNYEAFFNGEMENRRLLQYPPYCRLVRILVSGEEERETLLKINAYAEMLRAEPAVSEGKCELLGPSPAPLTFLSGRYRYHLLLKGDSLSELRELAQLVRAEAREQEDRLRIIIDIEPQNLL